MNVRKLFAAVLLIAACIAPQIAQAQTYAYRADAYTWDAVTAAATKTTWNTSCTGYPNSPVNPYRPGDDVFAVVAFPSGFTFPFAGTSYGSVRILSNGIIQFGPDAGFQRDYTPSALPITNTPGAYGGGCANAVPTQLMLVYWRDIDTGRDASSGVFYELKGTAPNRRFVITWSNVFLYNTATFYNFQVILNEDGTFKYQYGTGSSDGTGAAVGVQVSTADYTQYAYNQSFIDTTNGTAILWYPASVSPAEIGEYRLDESTAWGASPVPGETVIDSSGTNHPGTRVTVGTTYPARLNTARVCAGASIPSNTGNTLISAINIGQGPSTIGARGSISFWYRSTNLWRDSNSRTLFDATTVAARPFHLTKISTGGTNSSLIFALTDSANAVTTLSTGNQNFAANTWVHVGISWYLATGTNQSVMQIFINGAQANLRRFTSTGAINGGLGTIYFGDNRTSGVTPANGTANSAYGDLDEIRVYPFDMSAPQVTRDMNITRSVCAVIDHYSISHSGSGVTCQPENITITAHDISHNAMTLTGTTMTLATSTSHGTWSRVTAAGTLTNLGGGSATYVWSGESSIVLGLADTFAETLNINVASGGYTENSGTSIAGHDQNLTYSDAGFIFATAAGAEVTIPTQVAGQSSATYYLRGVKTDRTTMACQAALQGTRAINLAYQCRDPATCASGSYPVTVTAAETRAIAGNNLGSWASTTAVNMTFDANGYAPLTFSHADVGQIQLYAAATLTGVSVSGTSNQFVVKPYSLVLAAPITDNPGAGAVGDGVFKSAGTSFAVTVTAQAVGGTATPSYGHEATPETAALASTLVLPTAASGGANPVPTATFGAFTNGVATGTASWGEVGIITLTPHIGDSDYLGAGDLGAGDGSALTTSGNVGRFTPDHFGLAAPAITNRADINAGAGCAPASTFTYMGEPAGVSFTLAARNAAGTATTNYRNFGGGVDFTKFPLSSGTPANWTNIASNDSVGLWMIANGYSVPPGTCTAVFATAAPWATSYACVGVGNPVSINRAAGQRVGISNPAIAWNNSGVGTFTGNATLERADAPDGPFATFAAPVVASGSVSIGVVPRDGDGVTLPAADIAGASGLDADNSGTNERFVLGTTGFAYGRMRLGGGHGSELLPVRVPVAIDYFGIGGNWLRMAYDNCTTLASANVALENCQGALVAQCSAVGGTPNAGTILRTFSPATLNGGRTTLTLSRPGCPGATCSVGSVDVALNLGANPPATSADVSCNPVAPVPHPVGTGSANLPWLRFDWCRGASDPNGGDPLNDPNARVKFGSPKASYIYMRERY